MAAGVGRLVVDCGIDEIDERLEQVFHLADQAPVGQRNGGLRCERFCQMLVCPGKGHNFAAACALFVTLLLITLQGVDKLQHTDDFVLVVAHRYREKRSGTVAGTPVESPGTGKIVARGGIGVGDIHRLAMQGGMRHYHAVVRFARVVIETNGGKCNGATGGAAQRNAQGIGADNLELQHLPFRIEQVQRARVRMGDALGRHQYGFQQAGDVLLAGERDADGIQLIQPAQQIVGWSCARIAVLRSL